MARPRRRVKRAQSSSLLRPPKWKNMGVSRYFPTSRQEKRKTYFWFSMEQLPADARAAPSASVPNDADMGIASSPKRPRDPAQDNKRACQSLAHHTTLTGRCRKTVDTWAPLYEEPQSRSTTSNVAERLRKQGNSAILAAVHYCSTAVTRRRYPSANQPASHTPPARKRGASGEGHHPLWPYVNVEYFRVTDTDASGVGLIQEEGQAGGRSCSGLDPAWRAGGCLGWLRVCFKAVFKAPSNVVWVVDWVSRGREFGECKEGWFGRPSGRHGCRRFARLGLRLFCLLLVPGAKECPQAPKDDAGGTRHVRKPHRVFQAQLLKLLIVDCTLSIDRVEGA
eukprot:scaffold13606_cov118-Isochrysis_galbana.AAC.6